MKSYADLEQSKRLAEILPLDSADIFLAFNGTQPVMSKYIDDGFVLADDTAIPCWSLAALLEILPDEIIDDNGYNILLNIEKYDLKYQISYFTDLNFSDKIKTDEYENLVDACVEMILKLHEQKLI